MSFCKKNKVCPHNNLAVTFPELIIEFDKERNAKSPEEYSYGSNEYVWWKCKENNNHKWHTTVASRTTNKSGCSFCFNLRSKHGYSKAAIDWLKSIEEKENIKIQYIDPENGISEYVIPGIGKVDGYCYETNTVYEFHGDFWHGNPNVFNLEDINHINGKKFRDLYTKTIDKENKIRKAGYNLIVKWESDSNFN